MISKKVITRTIPTVYSDSNEEFMIARDSFSLVNNSKVKPLSSTILHNQANNFNFNASSVKSSSNNSINNKKLNTSLNSGPNLNSGSTNSKPIFEKTSVNPVSYFDFHVKKENENFIASKKAEVLLKQKLNQVKQSSPKYFENDSPTNVPLTPFQQNFQKYVIERHHVNHFNHRQPSNTKPNLKHIFLDKKITNDDGGSMTGSVNSLNNKSNFYNKSYFYSETASDTKSINEKDRFEKVNIINFSDCMNKIYFLYKFAFST